MVIKNYWTFTVNPGGSRKICLTREDLVRDAAAMGWTFHADILTMKFDRIFSICGGQSCIGINNANGPYLVRPQTVTVYDEHDNVVEQFDSRAGLNLLEYVLSQWQMCESFKDLKFDYAIESNFKEMVTISLDGKLLERYVARPMRHLRLVKG